MKERLKTEDHRLKNNMNNLLLITGAGASHDIFDVNRVSFSTRNYQPPLTKDLFLFGGGISSLYSAQCQKGHPMASQVGHDFYNSFGENSEASNLETFLMKIKNSKSKVVQKKFWAIPLYFFDLFEGIGRHYTSTNTPGIPSNYESLLASISESDYDQVIWLNLNYDLLADFVIKSTAPSNQLEDFNNYMDLVIPGKKSIKLKYTKPHGSIDWFKLIKDPQANSRVIDLEEIKIGKVPDDLENLISEEVIKAHVNSDGAIVGRSRNWYPAITAPIGKYKFVYQVHIDEIIPHLKETYTILCIGFSALDSDILDLIDKNIPEIKKMKIVNGNGEFSGQAYDRIYAHCNRKKISRKDSSLFTGTFSQFMQDKVNQWLSEK